MSTWEATMWLNMKWGTAEGVDYKTFTHVYINISCVDKFVLLYAILFRSIGLTKIFQSINHGECFAFIPVCRSYIIQRSNFLIIVSLLWIYKCLVFKARLWQFIYQDPGYKRLVSRL